MSFQASPTSSSSSSSKQSPYNINGKVLINPANQNIIMYYDDGTIHDTLASIHPAILIIDLPATSYVTDVMFTNKDELTLSYGDGTIHNLGNICKCNNVMLSHKPTTLP